MIDRNSYEPLYVQIRKDIEQKILNGEIKIGDKLMSETEMLHYYNVGRVTVRAALSELVSEGCLKKEQGLGTFCAALPGRERRKSVDVLLNTGDTYFIPYFLAGIGSVLDKENCNLILHDTLDSMENITRILHKIVERGTDGIILQPYTGSDVLLEDCRLAIELCREKEIPLIAIDGELSGTDGIPCLVNDDRSGGLIAVRYLIANGHEKILGLFQNRYRDSGFRAAGFEQGIREAGLEAYLFDSDKASYQEILQVIRKKHVTAIVCYNDRLAVECCHYLAEAGLKVPEDVSIVGYDNTELAVASYPRITSITHPKNLMGEKAAELLLELISGKKPERFCYIFNPELIERDSISCKRQESDIKH